MPSDAAPPDSPADPWQEHNARLVALIAQARSRDVTAFEELYRLTARWMLARVRRMVDDGQAEDVLAEVYLQVWSSLETYDEKRGHPGAWMASIARSRALDHLRRQRRELAETHLEEEAPSSEEGPENLLSRAQDAHWVRLCLGELEARERMVLGLAYFRDCTHSEIAAETGMPLGVVKSVMSSAQRKLRRVLTDRGLATAVAPVQNALRAL